VIGRRGRRSPGVVSRRIRLTPDGRTTTTTRRRRHDDDDDDDDDTTTPTPSRG